MCIGQSEDDFMNNFWLYFLTDIAFIAKLVATTFLSGSGIGVGLSEGVHVEFLAHVIR